jgi:hypothetical protein
MNLFDVMGVASKIPFELVQKLEGDMPKLQQLLALEKQAEPHVTALEPIINQAKTIYDSISPDVLALVSALENKA